MSRSWNLRGLQQHAKERPPRQDRPPRKRKAPATGPCGSEVCAIGCYLEFINGETCEEQRRADEEEQ